METKWLQDFVCLNNEKSFRRSAELRHISQSAFSRRIKSLEHWIGADLIDRNSFPVQLTHAGSEFVEQAKGILGSIEKAKIDISALQKNPDNDLIIATHPSLAVTLVPKFINSINRPEQNLTYHIHNNLKSAESYLMALAQDTCDYLICYQHDAINFTPEINEYKSKILDHESLIPVVSNKKYMANKKVIPLIQYSTYTNLAKVINSTITSLAPKFQFKIVAEASIAETVKSFLITT